MFRFRTLGRVVTSIDRMILQIISRRTKHSEESTYLFPIAVCCLIWLSFFDWMSRAGAIRDSEATALTVIIVAASFCIVRYVKVSGDLWSAQTESNILQTKNSAVRIHNEADSLLGLQKSNSKGMSEAAQTKYAKEIRSELLVELEQERLFLESQMEQLSLAVTQAKQSANLLHEKEQTTYEKAAGVQQPVALAREKKTNLADQRKELNQKCQILQNEVDKTANVLVEKNRKLSSLQSEVAQLKNRLDNIQQEMSARRHSRKGQ